MASGGHHLEVIHMANVQSFTVKGFTASTATTVANWILDHVSFTAVVGMAKKAVEWVRENVSATSLVATTVTTGAAIGSVVTASIVGCSLVTAAIAMIAVFMLSRREEAIRNALLAGVCGAAAPYALVYGGLALLNAAGFAFDLLWNVSSTAWVYAALAILG